MIFQLLGYFGGAIVLLGYFVSVQRRNPLIFDYANVVGACLLIPANIYLGAYFGAALSLAFALIAKASIVRRHRELRYADG